MRLTTRILLLVLATFTFALFITSSASAGGNILSAGWGLDDALPVFPGCSESLGQDGMPMVLDSEVDNLTLDAEDFEIELTSGARRTPICATLLPAQEENEDRTVLLIGDLGSQSDPPRLARIVGDIRGENSMPLGGAVAVPAYDLGPSLVLAEVAALDQTQCPANSASALRLIFSSGVLSTDGDDFQSTELGRFTIHTLSGVFSPIGFSDLNDLDNNIELCLPTDAIASQVTVQENTAIDPNDDANLVTSVPIEWPDNALELNGLWYDPATNGEGITFTQGNQGIVAFFFGYDTSGERLWLMSDVISTYVYAGQPISIPLFAGDRGVFDQPESDLVHWGMLTITADSCESVRFDLNGLDGTKRLDTVRLADGGRRCELADEAPFEELYAQGVDRYLGTFSPFASINNGRLTTHTFDPLDNGPLCYTGEPYAMSTRDGTGEELLIFLMGGGACGPQGCNAVETPIPMIPFGILDATNPSNPAANYDVGWVSYCDGTLFSGDRDLDTNGDGVNDRYFRGMQNLSASLDVIAYTYPLPSRIILAGTSAGGSGVHFALPLVRKLYPNTPIELINDSGVGILPPGAQQGLNDYWNSSANFPTSCEDCIGEDGNLTGYHHYQLANDANLRMGFMSFAQDGVVADDFLMIGGPAFEAELLSAMNELEQAHPDRFRSFIVGGSDHTFLLSGLEETAGDVSARQWVSDMLSGSGEWISRTD